MANQLTENEWNEDVRLEFLEHLTLREIKYALVKKVLDADIKTLRYKHLQMASDLLALELEVKN